MARTLQPYRRTDRKWGWRIIGDNGSDIVATDGGQGYENKEDALNMGMSVFTGGTPYVFRVLREKVGDETVRVLLEPYTDIQVVDLHDGDEFITGSLAMSPWEG